MIIHLIIGPTAPTTDHLRAALKSGKEALAGEGIVFPSWNHIRLYMASADAEAVGLLRHRRGFATHEAQEKLMRELEAQLEELSAKADNALVLCNSHIGSMLHSPTEIRRLHGLLSRYSNDIRVTSHVHEQARVLAPLYAARVFEGRQHSLESELDLARQDGSWWDGALNMRETPEPHFGLFNEVQHPAPWLDYEKLLEVWEGVFGSGAVSLRPTLPDNASGADAAAELQDILEADLALAPPPDRKAAKTPSEASLARARQFNALLVRYMKLKEISLDRDIWRKLLDEISLVGAPLSPAQLAPISKFFAPANTRLIKRFPDLAEALKPMRKHGDWAESDGGFGFRASQYLTAFAHRIHRNSNSASALVSAQNTDFESLIAEGHMPDDEKKDVAARIKLKHKDVLGGRIRPHNKMGRVNEEELAAAYTEHPRRELPEGNSGNVIVGCMKNEAPYILEWVAYHRAMGVDNFLIYTNGCEDGTAELLDHLQEMGVLQHRDNDNWKGKSPQQHALNQSLAEPLIKNAEWIIHIDVDEFINVRVGNGTLDDLFKATRGATNIAMTWRLFGHNGVKNLSDQFVTEQFDGCAPKYCPKPHTVWGFKTMFKNIKGYRKISCHRPNQVIEEKKSKIKWVNGSGQDVTDAYLKGGWRSSKKTVGYDLVQLNHYALRSAESFLIKRQRGRALHVDRSIGLNYWIRMDWSDFRDITIKRNVPRARAEYDRLLADEKLRSLHESGLQWHKEKVQALHNMPEFQELFAQALSLKLTETERVAYALALDMES